MFVCSAPAYACIGILQYRRIETLSRDGSGTSKPNDIDRRRQANHLLWTLKRCLFVCILIPCRIGAFYCLSSVNCASRDIVALFTSCQLYYFTFFYQPEAGTGRRHLRHSRTIELLFYFLLSGWGWHRPEASPPQSPGWCKLSIAWNIVLLRFCCLMIYYYVTILVLD